MSKSNLLPLGGAAVAGSGGDGGGGGGVSFENLEIKNLWSGDIDITTANQWKAAGTEAVPDDAVWLIWNGGKFSAGDDDGPSALWTWINAVDWRALTADTVDTTPNDATGMLLVDWGATNIGDGTPDFARRDMVIGRTAANIPLITSTNTSEDFYGAQLKYVTKRSLTTGSGGAASDPQITELEENEALPTPSATSDKFIYRPGEPAQFWIKEEERHSQETGTATQTHILPGSADYPDFEGVLNYSPPVASASVGDYYFDYYYSRRHFYEFKFVGPQLTGANRWAGVAIDDITGDPLGPDAVFIGEAVGPHAAILLIDPDEYDASNKYYFIHVSERRLYLLSAITLPADPFLSYSYRALNEPLTALPTGIWYISGQTSRWPSSYSYTTQPASNRLRLQWSGNDPNEDLYGWGELGNIWPGAISGNIDGSANPANTTSNVVFSPPAGIYDIHVTMGTSSEGLAMAEFGLFLYKIQSGDDLILATTSARDSDLPANFGGTGGTVLRMDAPDIQVDDGDQFYIMTFSTATGTPNRRGFLKLTKKQ